jgi:hydroxymethylpyrimidine pyrophosphatase-like HAD family hydrolase
VEDQQEAPGLGVSGARFVLSFRLLAVDLDGTLLDAAGAVHQVDREAIETLAQRGIRTTIITGRLYSGTRHIATQLGASGAIACVDGSHLVDVASSQDLLHCGLSGNDATRLRDLLASQEEIAAFVFANDQILYDERGLPYLAYVRTWSVDHVRTERVTEHPHWSLARGITALVCTGPQRAILDLEQGLRGSLGDAVYTIAFPVRRFEAESTWGMVVRAAGYSKGTALRWLARHYGVDPQEVVAVGDWFNDVPMFEAAGRSFVMGQAPERVKEAATDRLEADASTGGGIAEAAVRAGLL